MVLKIFVRQNLVGAPNTEYALLGVLVGAFSEYSVSQNFAYTFIRNVEMNSSPLCLFEKFWLLMKFGISGMTNECGEEFLHDPSGGGNTTS